VASHPRLTKKSDLPQRNVVLLSVDTLGRSWLRAFNPDAPALATLDRFGESAARFGNALSPASWTLPAHASLLTGLYPDRHGATDPRRGLSVDVDTLASELLRQGLETVAFTDGGYLDPQFGFSRGFVRYDDSGALWWPRIRLPRFGRPNDQRGEDVFDRALAYLRQRKDGDPPFFLFLHTYAVHDYFKTTSVEAEHHLACLKGVASCNADEWTRLESLYADRLRVLDRALERLIDALSGSARRTLVFLVSDHGEGFDHRRHRVHHGGRLDADVLGVPVFVRGPGIQPRTISEAVSLVDIAPTVLDYLGLPVPKDLDGCSLMPALRGHPMASRPLYAFEYGFQWRSGQRVKSEVVQRLPLSVAVIDGSRWFIRSMDGDAACDLAIDPGQDRCLRGQAFEDLHRLATRRIRPIGEGRAVVPPASLRERLRSLGYLE
jgi:arylsulfatase A-like enzyme